MSFYIPAIRHAPEPKNFFKFFLIFRIFKIFWKWFEWIFIQQIKLKQKKMNKRMDLEQFYWLKLILIYVYSIRLFIFFIWLTNIRFYFIFIHSLLDVYSWFFLNRKLIQWIFIQLAARKSPWSVGNVHKNSEWWIYAW